MEKVELDRGVQVNHAGESGDFVPEVVVLVCQHCLRDEAALTAAARQAAGVSVRAEMLPCSAKIEVPNLMKILEHGADGVEVVACPAEACRSLIGSLRAEKRIAYARELLEAAHVGPERLGMMRKTALGAQELVEIAAARGQAARSLGPNPMKKGKHS